MLERSNTAFANAQVLKRLFEVHDNLCLAGVDRHCTARKAAQHEVVARRQRDRVDPAHSSRRRKACERREAGNAVDEDMPGAGAGEDQAAQPVRRIAASSGARIHQLEPSFIFRLAWLLRRVYLLSANRRQDTHEAEVGEDLPRCEA